MYNPKIKQKNAKFPSTSQFGLGHQKSKVQSASQTSKINNRNSFNNEILNACRQNYLNAGYYKRMANLKQITVQNKKIYQRINSQKTVYSKKDLNKSYESNSSISKRLSQSKLSKRELSAKGSRMSSREKIKKKKGTTKENHLYSFETQNIKAMKNNVINKFTDVFAKKQRHTLNRRQRSSSFAVSKEIQFPRISEKNTVIIAEKSENKPDGAMLHRIAQQMFQNPRTRKTLVR